VEMYHLDMATNTLSKAGHGPHVPHANRNPQMASETTSNSRKRACLSPGEDATQSIYREPYLQHVSPQPHKKGDLFTSVLGRQLTKEDYKFLENEVKSYCDDVGMWESKAVNTLKMFQKEWRTMIGISRFYSYASAGASTSTDYAFHEGNSVRELQDAWLIYGFISRTDAQEALKNSPVGTGLLRLSQSEPGRLVLCTLGKNGLIEIREDGLHIESAPEDQPYSTLYELLKKNVTALYGKKAVVPLPPTPIYEKSGEKKD